MKIRRFLAIGLTVGSLALSILGGVTVGADAPKGGGNAPAAADSSPRDNSPRERPDIYVNDPFGGTTTVRTISLPVVAPSILPAQPFTGESTGRDART